MSLHGLSYWRAVWPALRRDLGLLGWRTIARDMMHMKKAQWGWIKGVDEHGNRYMENLHHAEYCRRWVLYPSRRRTDPTRITPEWHMWLHRQVEETPDEMHLPRYKWQLPPEDDAHWHLSQMGYTPKYIPKGYYTRVIGIAPPMGHLADRQTQDQGRDRLAPPKASEAFKKHDPAFATVYTAESASTGPSTPATPSGRLASPATMLDTEEEGSPIRVHNGKLYEPWEHVKRDPKEEPRQELF